MASQQIRLVLVTQLPVKQLATLKKCLGLRESIVQLQEQTRILPFMLTKTRLDIAALLPFTPLLGATIKDIFLSLGGLLI